MRFENKVALITGGSSGIGAEVCVRFAEEGARVAVVASSSVEKAQVTADRCGGNAKAFICDVSDFAQVETLVADVIAEFGRIDILVNAAGVFYPTRIGETDEEMFDVMSDTNLKGCFFVCNAVAPHMIAGGGGKIVNLGSAAGTAGRSNYIVYSAVKAGVINMTRSLAAALAPHDINVNCLAPGNTATSMNENVRTEPEYAEIYQTIKEKTLSNRPFADPREMAGAVLFLSSDDASAAHGALLLMDEGVSAGY
ncbi:MAG: SDR family NAD(P)-dependent oxidoreductase [Alphaproteobacteria bacterium]|nr:SDR family NAD(P)-dependent oxidoreductase [Alphaproteobacteria bacterium]